MPVLKPISGHTSCRGIVMYLTKGDRSLAEDYLNCSGSDRLGRAVWQQMDSAREWAGNDRPVGGKAARTYEHFVLSPDPRDHVTVEQLRSLATEWATRYFDDYQCAIYYHQDNALGIPHAHVVVNNTNLSTGRRLSPSLTVGFEREIWDGLQGMAESRGLRSFDARGGSVVGAEHDEASMEPHVTVQADYRSKAVREALANGRFSWVEDVRQRASCAAMMSSDERGFLRECGVMGLSVRTNGRGDYVFTHPSRPTWQVSGARLGADWTRWGVGRRLARDSAHHMAKPQGERLEAIERAIAALSDGGAKAPQVIGTSRGVDITVADVSAMLGTCAAADAWSLSELGSLAHAKGSGPHVRQALRTAMALGTLPDERKDSITAAMPQPKVEGEELLGNAQLGDIGEGPGRGEARGDER
jgi:hypothetical protein